MTRSSVLIPPLLRSISNDEVPPLPTDRVARRALADVADGFPGLAGGAHLALPDYAATRMGTAATLRAIERAHGGGFFDVAETATTDPMAAELAFAGDGPVVDVQTHLVDATRWVGAHAAALGGFLAMVDPDRWSGGVDPQGIDAAAWAALVFGASETAVALLTSTPGPGDDNVLTNRQIGVARDLVERYAGTGRVLTHTIVHPNEGVAELEAMAAWSQALRPAAWKCYTLYGPPTASAPAGGWFLDDDEVGGPFLERVQAIGPRIVATHKGLGGLVPSASVATASPRDVGPAAAAHPDIAFVVYHSGYERDPDHEEGAYDPTGSGVDRLVRSVSEAGIGHHGNVYAELGTTWFLMLRRPREAAHVMGKLLTALGPERILWGTDSVWYGSPQPLIDAFRAFQIPEPMQGAYGYPALTTTIKDQILSHNARRLYGIPDASLEASHDRAWVGEAADVLRRGVEAAGQRSRRAR